MRAATRRLPAWPGLGVYLLLLGACGPDFTPAEEIDRLRIFGLRLEVEEREDSVAWPRVDEDLRLEALLTTESGNIDDVELSVRFCPLAFQSSGDLECVFDEESFEDLLLSFLPVPDGTDVELELDFDLEVLSSTVARFNLERQLLGQDAIDALEAAGVDPTPLIEDAIGAFCEQIQTQDFGEAVTRPDCDGTFDFRFDIRLRTPDEELQAVRQFVMIYDEAPPQLEGEMLQRNRNPRPSLLCAQDNALLRDTVESLIEAGTIAQSASFAIGEVDGRCVLFEVRRDMSGRVSFIRQPELDATLQTFTGDAAVPLFFDSNYTLLVADLCGAIPATSPEDRSTCAPDVDVVQALDPAGSDEPESLNLSWFADTQQLDSTVTALELGNPDAPLSEARSNTYETPRRIDFQNEDEPLPLELFVVVRDGLGRGGRAFLRGSYTLTERPGPVGQ